MPHLALPGRWLEGAASFSSAKKNFEGRRDGKKREYFVVEIVWRGLAFFFTNFPSSVPEYGPIQSDGLPSSSTECIAESLLRGYGGHVHVQVLSRSGDKRRDTQTSPSKYSLPCSHLS